MISITNKVYSNNFARLADEFRDRAIRAVKESAAVIESNAKVLAPVDTGNLRSSIQTSEYYIGRDGYALLVGTHVHYAPYQEYGTATGVPAHPFLTPAADMERPVLELRLSEIFG